MDSVSPAEGYDFSPFNIGDTFVPSVTRAADVVRSLDDDEFDLLLRAVDLVVLSQAFDEQLFAIVLQVAPETAALIESLLVRLEVLSDEEADGHRVVLADMNALPLILLRLNEGRVPFSAAA